MKDKEFVKLAHKICPVCTKEHEHNTEILLHKYMDNIKGNPITGYELCEEHDELLKQGYLAIIICDENKSTFNENGTLNLENAYRTGDFIHIKRETYNHIFNIEVPEDLPLVFGGKELFNMLQEL